MSSDLISTPSRTQSPVSNEAFEALIDLLASDGIDDDQPERDASTRANLSLRDASGKLDYAKIRTMFVAQKSRVEDDESEDEYRSHQSSSTVPSRAHSMSPKPVDRTNACHRRSSTFGNQPCQWASIHENPTAKGEVTHNQPLSFDELNAALAGAHEEVKSLRAQYDQLQALVSKCLGNQLRPCPVAPVKENVKTDLPVEIADLSEEEAKRALNTLVRSLNVSLDGIGPMAAGVSPTPSSPSRQHDVASIVRAVKFLGSVDELVWRRGSPPSGPRTLLPVFSEENAVSLLARLELWERAVRRSTRT